MIRAVLIASWLMCASQLMAQTVNLSDSLRHVFSLKAMPTAKLDSRNSFISGRSARVHGIKTGVSFGKRLSLGLGYNWIRKGAVHQEIRMGDNFYNADVHLRYIAPFAEYSFYKKGNWEATIPVQIGFGRSFLLYNNGYRQERLFQHGVVLYEPGMSLEYKIMNLVGVGAGLGYRIMLKNNHEIDHSFTSPMYVVRFRVIFDEIYKQAKSWYDKQ
ncbi:MAG TPA: hypothetical protein VIK71_01545 [Flavobacteriales bacterium]